MSVVLGVIGCGRIGKTHLGNIAKGVRGVTVKYVCDLLIESDGEMAKFAAENAPGAVQTTDYRVVMADSEVAAVLCLTSTNAHVEVCRAAIDAGKHVFCEKPVAMSVEETRELLERSERRGVHFQVGFNRRFDHNFAQVRKTVESGRIGKATVVHVISRDPTYDMNYIRRSIEEGGMFVDMTIHDFDMVQFIAGPEDPIVEVYALGTSVVAPDIGELGDIDTAVVTLRTQSGMFATIDNTRRTDYGYDQRLEVLGTKGCVQCDNDRPTTCRYLVGDGLTETDRIQWWFLERYPQAFIQEINDFVALVRSNDPAAKPQVSLREMIRAMNVAYACIKSQKTGLPVKVDQF